MERENRIHSMIMSFFVITACICIMEGVIGVLFLPEATFGCEAFLMPPAFGVLCALSGVVFYSSKELSMGAMAFRMVLQLVLIELIVLAANFFWGDWENLTVMMKVMLIAVIALIYIIVHVVMWMNDRRHAIGFNEQLLKFQMERKA